MEYNSHPIAQQIEIGKFFKNENNSSEIAKNIQLPNLNSGKKKIRSTPLKQKIKNRRNLSIKQNWEQSNFGMRNMTAKNSGFISPLKQPSQNPSSEEVFRKSMNPKVMGQHNIDTTMKFLPGNNEALSPTTNIIETGESPNSRGGRAETEYYGAYAKVSD